MYFVNTNRKQCGVNTWGLMAYEAIKNLGFKYTEDLNSLPNDSIYVFNWHSLTSTGVISQQLLRNLGGKSIGFLHDPYDNPPFFDIKCRLDPDFDDEHPLYSVPRIIKNYDFPEIERNRMTVGSWGFGGPDKHFEKIVSLVESQFNGALIRFHIPFSDLGDSQGLLAMESAKNSRALAVKNDIEITHNYRDMDSLVKWAHENTINIFFRRENVQAGISSCADVALMSKRPVGVNRSPMFKHVYGTWNCIDSNSISQIIEKGYTQEKFRECWTEENFRNKIKELLGKLHD